MTKEKNAFQLLRERRLAESTTEFTARGKSVIRCKTCQMADYACICAWKPEAHLGCEFVLLLHRIEVFKPTNTGRLLADIFPHQTHAFCWDRTAPDEQLIKLLQDENRQCFIVFPADTVQAKEKNRPVFEKIPVNNKLTTFILLDGTWKQSSRMFHLSHWLENIPCVSLPEGTLRRYAVRKSHQEDYLSTAEAAALCLQLANEEKNAELLLDYFDLFNAHYLATRGCYPPVVGELHARLISLQTEG